MRGWRKRWFLGVLIMVLAASAVGCRSYEPVALPEVLKAERQMAQGEVTRKPMAVLPSSYDCRTAGRAPVIKSQGTSGTCWAFASLTALELSLLPEKPAVFSADHMTRMNSFSQDPQAGGFYSMAMAYLLAWQGPVLEEQDPYGDGWSPEGLLPVVHVQEIQILPDKDYEAIKEAVYRYGGVESALHMTMEDYNAPCAEFEKEWHSYCYLGGELPNHDLVIVGWDDNFPREHFSAEAEGDGAFLCVSSWGAEFGEGGYFYVSYYDTQIGKNNVVYTGIDSEKRYDQIYQTDLCGWVGHVGFEQKTEPDYSAYGANIYTARGRESLLAVGFYATLPQVSYEIYVAEQVDGTADLNQRRLAASGTLENRGFYTVKLSEPVLLEPGQRFAVIAKLSSAEGAHLLAVEYEADEATAGVILSDGEGCISDDGSRWMSVESDYGYNLCLKAYTASGDWEE